MSPCRTWEVEQRARATCRGGIKRIEVNLDYDFKKKRENLLDKIKLFTAKQNYELRVKNRILVMK